jgi:hypothetical protein
MDKYDFLREADAVKNIPDVLAVDGKTRKRAEKDVESTPARRKAKEPKAEVKDEPEERPKKLLKIRPSSDELVNAPTIPEATTMSVPMSIAEETKPMDKMSVSALID